MKHRDLLLGLLVVALVGLGVYWARNRQTAPSGASAAGSAAAAPRVPAPDVTATDGSVDLGDARIVMSIAPRPPVAFRAFRARVRVEGAAALDSGRVYFEMTMPMGDHRYSLRAAADGWHEADVVLPLCASGDRRWFASVEGMVAGRPRVARFEFTLAPPGPEPHK